MSTGSQIGASSRAVGTVFIYNGATVTGTGSAKELNLIAGTEYVIAKVGLCLRDLRRNQLE